MPAPVFSPALAGSRQRTGAYALLAGAALLWAGNYVIGRAISGQVPPVALAFWRWALAGVVLAPFAARDVWEQRALVARQLPVIAALALLGVAVFPTTVYAALQRTTATNAALLLSAAPAVTLLASRVLFGERIGRRRSLGVALSTAGVLVLLFRAGTPGGSRAGDALAAGTAATWGVYCSLLPLRSPELRQRTFLAVSAGIGLLALLPFFLWERAGAASGDAGHLTRGGLWAIAYLALGPSLLAYLCWNTGTAAIGPARASVFNHLTPLGTVAFGVGVLGEPFRPAHLVGAALILSGVVIVQRGR